jgi:mono/diheme cytochrome c family protein
MKAAFALLAAILALGALVSVPKSVAAASNGAAVYKANCQSCHGALGAGITGAFPPLAKNADVTGAPAKVIHIVKYGLTGKITVSGSDYNGTMPAWGSQLSDGDIAAVITYIRSSWGNKAGPVTAAAVGAVKK